MAICAVILASKSLSHNKQIKNINKNKNKILHKKIIKFFFIADDVYL
jgi:hypothetical protein